MLGAARWVLIDSPTAVAWWRGWVLSRGQLRRFRAESGLFDIGRSARE
jgi:hypothetical protein